MPDLLLGNYLNIQNFPTNTPRVLHVETTSKPSFPRRFKVEYTWCVCGDLGFRPVL